MKRMKTVYHELLRLKLLLINSVWRLWLPTRIFLRVKREVRHTIARLRGKDSPLIRFTVGLLLWVIEHLLKEHRFRSWKVTRACLVVPRSDPPSTVPTMEEMEKRTIMKHLIRGERTLLCRRLYDCWLHISSSHAYCLGRNCGSRFSLEIFFWSF